MAANNETGVLFDLERIIAMAHAAGAVVHTDATQLVGRIPINLSELDIDLLSLSAHKFGGPQGVGALFIRRDLGLCPSPLLHGGGQENGWRAGTLNVAGIVGTGAAAAVTQAGMPAEVRRVTVLRDMLEDSLLDRIPSARLMAAGSGGCPTSLALLFPAPPPTLFLRGCPI